MDICISAAPGPRTFNQLLVYRGHCDEQGLAHVHAGAVRQSDVCYVWPLRVCVYRTTSKAPGLRRHQVGCLVFPKTDTTNERAGTSWVLQV